MLVTTQTEEVHQAKSKLIDGIWLFSCDECSFEANYIPDLKRFSITVCGNPFVSHTCHHEQQEPNIRDLVNQLDIETGEMEIEF